MTERKAPKTTRAGQAARMAPTADELVIVESGAPSRPPARPPRGDRTAQANPPEAEPRRRA